MQDDTETSLREQAIALREQGLSYRVIGERLGCSYSKTYELLNPGQWREQNQKRKHVKKRWSRENAWKRFKPCPTPGCDNWCKKSARECRPCRNARLERGKDEQGHWGKGWAK